VSRQPGGTRPVSSAMAGRTVFVVLVMAGLGLLVLKNAFDDDGSASGGTPSSTTVHVTTTVSSASSAPTTTIDKKSFKVIVANGSGVAGSAGKWTNGLTALGYTMLPATNATQSGQATSTVYFLPGAEAAAQDVAKTIGATNVAAWPSDNPPVKAIGDANVVIVLGQDVANKQPPAPAG
jgi:hypothetical protein